MRTNTHDAIAIREYFYSFWPDNIRVVEDNADPVEEDDEAGRPVGVWCRLTIRPGASRAKTIGPRDLKRYEQLGRIYLQVFTPKGDGMRAGQEVADMFANNMRDWRTEDGALYVEWPEYSTLPDDDTESVMITVSLLYRSEH